MARVSRVQLLKRWCAQMSTPEKTYSFEREGDTINLFITRMGEAPTTWQLIPWSEVTVGSLNMLRKQEAGEVVAVSAQLNMGAV